MDKKEKVVILTKLHKAFGDVFLETDVSVSDSMELLNDYYAFMVRQYEEQFVPADRVREYRGDVAMRLMIDIGCEVDVVDCAGPDDSDTLH